MTLFRFSNHEVKLEIDSIQELVGMRVGNVHQISKDTIIIKFWKLGVTRNLLIKNGIRFHLTEFPREKPKTPPDFCCRLRKLLRFRRLDDIIQPGNDRAVYFCFGDLRLCLELFQAGNIILFQQSDSKILAVLRYHVIQGTTIVGVNQPYMVDQFRDYVPPTDEFIHESLKNIPEKTNQKIRTYLTKIFPFHRHTFFDHAMTVSKIPLNSTLETFVYDKDKVDIFIKEMRRFDEILLSKPAPRPPRQQPSDGEPQPPEPEVTVLPPKPIGYLYSPKNVKDRCICGIQLAQWDPKFVTKCDTFDIACDKLWSEAELETAQKSKKQIESIPERKVNSVKRNFEKKKQELQEELDRLNLIGQLINEHATEIENCRNIINSFIGNHIRWDEIRLAIRAYQESGNPLASMIDKVEFEQGKFWALITDNEGDVHRVLIDLRKSAYANSSFYYDSRLAIAEKLKRTSEKEKEVVKKVDKEAQRNKKSIAMSIQEKRKTWWFERFHWFITTENYLVLAGRDKIQNDVLVKHYLKKDDIYLHAEIHGAASVIIKNPNGHPISPISLQQAAEFAVARSTAWKTNEPCQCFWVYANQVKKVLGQEQAKTGSFFIVGEKNYMTMTMPQMGLGILFHVTEEHVKNHLEERRIRVESDYEGDTTEDEPVIEQIDSADIAKELPFQNVETEEEVKSEVKSEVKLVDDTKSAGEENKKDEEEGDDDEEEELSDYELARIAMEEPERADVARRRKERKEKRNRPKPKPQPLEQEVIDVMENEGLSVDIDVEGINSLTGQPLRDDEFYAAYIMVAPLSALNNFKYKVKFTPGDMKKGKAWPVIQNYFVSMKGVPPEEIALIKLVNGNDVINQLPFNLRISLGAGGTLMQNKKKAAKKNRKKKK
ncbi:nuclear export mediator factor NEMF [Histomonas meleagridis]|uniref:nuclear export mediator factor NEMF-like n=1 Tax=Histomonas meleagridis TaxID=135588 RepID=UPI00355A4A21|nr:nuclear export mediator factor NEMF [Histomonas meleagridis]KAH0802424.1 nuclear export mediator factor NEMF-like [Histomonas meleagridis]